MRLRLGARCDGAEIEAGIPGDNKGSVAVGGCSKYPEFVVGKFDGEVNELSLAGEEENPGTISPLFARSAAFCVRLIFLFGRGVSASFLVISRMWAMMTFITLMLG